MCSAPGPAVSAASFIASASEGWAWQVSAMGRNKRVLDALARLDPKRIVPVPAEGGQNAAKEIVAAADGADVVLDAVGATDDATSTMNAIRALGPGGTAVLVGGVNSELSIHYLSILNKEMTLCGSIWFPRSAAAEMLAMIACGAVDLGPLSVRRFPLDQVNEALAAAVEERRSGLKHIALVP